MTVGQLLKSKSFYPLFWTQFLGAFNDNFLKNALVILVTVKSIAVFGFPPAQTVAIAGGVFILPFFLFSALAGQLSDKFDKSKVLQAAKLLEILIMAFSCFAFYIENYEFLLITLFLMGLQSTFFGPAKFSILPQHLKDEDLVGANAIIEAGTFLAILIGTIMGGVVIVMENGPFVVSAILMIIAVFGYFMSFKIPLAASTAPALNIRWNPITTTWQIMGFAKKDKAVFLAILGASWFWFAGALLLSIFPPLCKEVLHSDESMITLFLSVFSVGIGIGSLICEKLSYKRVELGLVPFGSFGVSGFCLLLYFQFEFLVLDNVTVSEFIKTTEGVAILLSLLGLSIVSGMFIVPLNAVVQERSEPQLRSRIISANNVINALFMVLASVFLLILLQAGVSIPKVFLILAVLNGLVAIYIYTLLPEFLFRFCVWILARLMYRMRVGGEEHVPDDGPAVFVCNHVTFVDWLILSAAVRRPMCFVMDHSFFKGFLIKKLMTQAKVIPITSAKINEAVYNAAFEKIAQELRAGNTVCIFPEGKLTYDGEMNELKPGVLKIIETTPVPVVPMALSGMWGSFFSRQDLKLLKKRPRKLWAKIHVDISEAIGPEQVTLELLAERISSLRRNP